MFQTPNRYLVYVHIFPKATHLPKPTPRSVANFQGMAHKHSDLAKMFTRQNL